MSNNAVGKSLIQMTPEDWRPLCPFQHRGAGRASKWAKLWSFLASLEEPLNDHTKEAGESKADTFDLKPACCTRPEPGETEKFKEDTLNLDSTSGLFNPSSVGKASAESGQEGSDFIKQTETTYADSLEAQKNSRDQYGELTNVLKTHDEFTDRLKKSLKSPRISGSQSSGGEVGRPMPTLPSPLFDVLLSQWSKLFHFRDGGWDERGLGNAKIVRHRCTGVATFSFHQSGTMELLANSSTNGDDQHCDLRPSGSQAKIWHWTAVDFSQHSPCIDKFDLKFGTTEAATIFKDLFNSVKVQNLAARFMDTDTLNRHLKFIEELWNLERDRDKNPNSADDFSRV